MLGIKALHIPLRLREDQRLHGKVYRGAGFGSDTLTEHLGPPGGSFRPPAFQATCRCYPSHKVGVSNVLRKPRRTVDVTHPSLPPSQEEVTSRDTDESVSHVDVQVSRYPGTPSLSVRSFQGGVTEQEDLPKTQRVPVFSPGLIKMAARTKS